MVYDIEDVEENFNKFVQSIDQYVKEPIKDFASIKPQLDIFKTHRPIKVGDYQYGISKSLEENSQLIIHHLKNDHSLVREYFKCENDTWTCCECYSTSGGESSEEDIAYALVLHGIVFAKLGHYCKPRRLSAVMNIQKFFKEKNVAKVIDLQRKYFGKEDLNGVSPKRKRGARKLETKACSSIALDEICSEIRLQNAQKKYRDSQDDEPSTMDENCNENQEKLSPEEAFAKIIENLGEYTNETKEVVMANKTKLLSILKSNRPMKSCNYLYGLSENLGINRRLIVFEWNDRRRVHEYCKCASTKFIWSCIECYRIFRCHGKNDAFSSLRLVCGIVFVSFNHKCEPRDYELVAVYQKCLEDGDVAKAQSIARKDGFAFKENLKRKMVSDSEIDSFSRDKELRVLKKSKHIELATKDTVTNEEISALVDDEKRNEKLINKSDKKKEVDLSSQQKSAIPREIKNKSSVSTALSIYHFEKPSTSKLEEICVKLNIEYHNNAAKLWDTIKFNQIDTVTPSTNMQTHAFKTENFFQILSIFFTGKSEQHRKLKTTIIDAFREKAVSYGLMSMNDFNIRFMHALTDGHFIFIANFLKCRILIFDGKKKPKKYGNWESTSNECLTLVVAFKGGDYSIVLDL